MDKYYAGTIQVQEGDCCDHFDCGCYCILNPIFKWFDADIGGGMGITNRC